MCISLCTHLFARICNQYCAGGRKGNQLTLFKKNKGTRSGVSNSSAMCTFMHLCLHRRSLTFLNRDETDDGDCNDHNAVSESAHTSAEITPGVSALVLGLPIPQLPNPALPQ